MTRKISNPIIKNISPRSAMLFSIGFIAAFLILVFAAVGLLGDDPLLESTSRSTKAVLIGNAILITALAGVVAVRFRRRLRARRFGEPAPRLHMRFVGLFSIAAAAPAILSAVFLGAVLNRGVDFWFGERISSLVDGVGSVARDFYNEEANRARFNAIIIAEAISTPDAVSDFTSSRIRYVRNLNQLTARAGFSAAYIIDSRGTLLARSQFPENESYVAPSRTLIELADEGGFAVQTPETAADGADVMRSLHKLDAYEDVYLFVSQPLDLDMFRRIGDARSALRTANDAEDQIRQTFIILYLEVAALIMIGSIWLALSAATRVVTPISRLVAAAERVRRGDLDARVQMGREDDEIAALGRAFNRMTRQLRSQRRELIESHAESEQRRAFIEAVLAGVSAGVVGLDGEDKVTLLNRSAVSLLGPETDDVVGLRLEEISPQLAEIVIQARRRPGFVAEAQIDLETNDSQIRNLSVRASMDEEAGLVLTFDDVTRLVTAQRNSAWRDVARRIAHEIKNPLTPIQLSAERLKRKYRKEITTDLEIFDRCTETIVRQVNDIGRMVDEFSSFARMPQPKVEEVEMGEMAQAAVFAQRVTSPKIELSYDRPEAEIHALCDARLSSQALANILKNAAESVSSRVDRDGEAGETGRIGVAVRTENDFAVIEVSDNGLGWPTTNRERLTEPYMTTREKGTGLGLAIVKRVMEDHKGRLELGVPANGQGALVRLVFPLVEQDEHMLAAENEA